MDSILWDSESDNYTQRALDAVDRDPDKLFAHHRVFAQEGHQVMDSFGFRPERVLDLGCGYGGAIQAFGEQYPDAWFEGIDPGEKSVEMARSLVTHPRANFQIGLGHQVPFSDKSFDLIMLVMVLQWVPRSHLIRTVAEVERVLRTGGLIMLWDFLPSKMVMSQSRHNEQVYIFKNAYHTFFTAFPWMQLVHHYTRRIEMGPDYQFSCSFIRKLPIKDVYALVPGPSENA